MGGSGIEGSNLHFLESDTCSVILQHDPALHVLPVVRPPLELTGGNGFLECQRVIAGFHQAYTVEPVLDARPSHNYASLIPNAWWSARIHGPVSHFQNIQGGGDVMRRCIDARAISRIVILIIQDLIFRPEKLPIVIGHAIFDPTISSLANAVLESEFKVSVDFLGV